MADSPITDPELKRHWQMLWIAGFVLVCSFCFQVVDNGKVAFRWWTVLQVPETCLPRRWFNVECPGCGLTRSFIYLAQGQLDRSIQVNRVGWCMAIAVLLQFPYRIASIRLRRPAIHPEICRWFGNGIIVMLILNWTWNQIASHFP